MDAEPLKGNPLGSAFSTSSWEMASSASAFLLTVSLKTVILLVNVEFSTDSASFSSVRLLIIINMGLDMIRDYLQLVINLLIKLVMVVVYILFACVLVVMLSMQAVKKRNLQ